MSNPDISTIRCLDLDALRKAEHFRRDNKIYVRVGNSDADPLYITYADDPNESDLTSYDEALSVGINSLTEIISYIVPPSKILNLDLIEVSGDNVAKYIVTINGSTNKIKRTYYGNSLNATFNYNSFNVNAGEEVKVEVIHYNDLNESGDFNATIEGKIKDA